MTLREKHFGVWLSSIRVGLITQRGDHTRFVLDEEYRSDPDRPVLGLIFEQNPTKPHMSALRLPPWFSNLLPEGTLRFWVADDRGVSVDREMELLAQVGHDLPGAVRVLPINSSESAADWETPDTVGEGPLSLADVSPGWRFSLAGVQMKFSVLREGDRLTLPASGEGGDWIVKLPDRQYPHVPRNEFAMMSLAAAVGIDVPELRLVHRDQIVGLPAGVWPNNEEWAYAIRRFDRTPAGGLVHIEDLAQVCNIYPDRKYSGNFETVASLLYRKRDTPALREFARRLAFIVLIGNGDAHLKNWSLIYRDPRMPTISPAYDLVSTAVYSAAHGPEDLGLRFGGSKSFGRVQLATFQRLEDKLAARDACLAQVVTETVTRTMSESERHLEVLGSVAGLGEVVANGIAERGRSLLRK